MQLRAQAAMQAVQERQMVAQAEYLSQHAAYFKAKAEQEEAQQKNEDALSQAMAVRHQINTQALGMSPEESMQQLIPQATMVNPVLGEKMAKAYGEYRKGAVESQFTPQVTQPIDVTTGKPAIDEMGRPIKAMTTGRGSAITVDREPTQVALIKYFVSEHNKAIGVGKNDLAEALRGGLAKATTGTGFTLQTNPDGTLTFTQGPVGGPEALTTANRSKTQVNMQQALSTIDVANRLEPLISDETVGAKAFAKSWINDRILAQRFPELASTERAGAEQLAAQLRASAVKELRSDSNITDGERKQILQAVPTINDPVDSPARAKQLVKNIRKMSAVHAMVHAKALGVPVPKSAAMALEATDLADLHEKGLITTEQAKEAYQLSHQ